MQMNPNIILAGQGVNALGALNSGTQAASNTNELARANALTQLFQEQGAGIAAGEQGALNALAGLDPTASLGIQEAHLGMDSTRQQMRLREETAQRARAAAARAAQAHAAQMSAAEVAEGRNRIAQGLATAVPHLRDGNLDAFNQVVRTAGLEPVADLTAGAFLVAQYEGALEGYTAAMDVLGQDTGPQFRPATPEEAARYGATAGQIDTGTGRFYPGQRPQSGTTVFDPATGQPLVRIGGGGEDEARLQPSSTASMIATIDGILADPALDTATGLLAPLQNIPGTAQYRFGTRADQLSGQAFLQAFESLKGGGQITELEGQQATRAIGRLDSRQSPQDYREALTELRALLEAAQSRPLGWADNQGAPSEASPQGPQASAWVDIDPEVQAVLREMHSAEQLGQWYEGFQ